MEYSADASFNVNVGEWITDKPIVRRLACDVTTSKTRIYVICLPCQVTNKQSRYACSARAYKGWNG